MQVANGKWKPDESYWAATLLPVEQWEGATFASSWNWLNAGSRASSASQEYLTMSISIVTRKLLTTWPGASWQIGQMASAKVLSDTRDSAVGVHFWVGGLCKGLGWQTMKGAKGLSWELSEYQGFNEWNAAQAEQFVTTWFPTFSILNDFNDG